jgi:hypothetical protein
VIARIVYSPSFNLSSRHPRSHLVAVQHAGAVMIACMTALFPVHYPNALAEHGEQEIVTGA